METDCPRWKIDIKGGSEPIRGEWTQKSALDSSKFWKSRDSCQPKPKVYIFAFGFVKP